MRDAPRLAVAAAVAVLALTGCGTGSSPAGAGSGSSAATVEQPADRSFAEGILPLESQYSALVDIAVTGGGGPDVRDMAAFMASHTGDMAAMRARMRAWGRTPPSPGFPTTMGPGMMGGTPEMMHGGWGDQRLWCVPGARTNLSGLTGSSFDSAWLAAVAAVAQAEISLCRTELAVGSDSGTRAIAQQILIDRQNLLTHVQAAAGSSLT